MKIGIMSDIHLEFGPYEGEIPEVDVMVLAGDIATARMLRGIFPGDAPSYVAPDKEQYTWEFFELVRHKAEVVIYVAGNHEYYGMEFGKANRELALFCATWGFYFLNKEEVLINGVPFRGATLWTDPGDPFLVQNRMSDYSRIKFKDGNRYRKLRVTDTVREHDLAKNFIFDGALDDAIIVTHHLPAKQCIPPMYRMDRLNAGYYTDLEELIRCHRPRFWLHGHTHEKVDVEVGVTRIIANPRGYYGHEPQAHNYEVKVIEI